MLRTRNLGVSFGGHRAVADVDSEFHAGTLTAVVGPNGAGKTTFFNLISGQIRATTGEVFLLGENISALSAPARTRKGLGRAFQLTNLFPRLSVMLAVQGAHDGPHRKAVSFFTSMWSEHVGIVGMAERILEETRLAPHRSSLASMLSHGDQRKLEVAMMMALDPQVYMFDEPTAGMTRDEAPVILDLIRALKNRTNKTVLLVEHKMEVVSELADRVLVMHEGRVVADGLPATVMALPVVQEAYLGKTKPVATADL